MKKILKVGFDLDGVILYNPIRLVRPIAKSFKPFKSFFLKQKKELFYFPKTKIEQFLFRLLHKTSFIPDPALNDIKKLVIAKEIEAYIVTGRYSFLKKDSDIWLKKIKAKTIFKECFQNKNDLQPNKFKEKMIKKLNLDVYIEDNWDIVQKLEKSPLRQGYSGQAKVKIFWLTNILDRHIPYQYKFNNLKEALKNLPL